MQTRVLHRTGAKPLVVTGMALGVVGNVPLHPPDARRRLRDPVLPGLLIIGLGMGCVFAPAFSTATLGVADHEAGIASAMVNTSQQVGGSVGTALLSTLFASATASYASTHTPGRNIQQLAASTATRPRSGGQPGSSRSACSSPWWSCQPERRCAAPSARTTDPDRRASAPTAVGKAGQPVPSTPMDE